MATSYTDGATLARRDAEKFRVAGYNEVRAKATEVAGQILLKHAGETRSLVVVPILLGGGPPARLVVDALLGYGVVHSVVPCRIRRYQSVGQPGTLEFTLPLRREDVAGRTVIGIDDMVDGGETMAAFVEHALSLGAAAVEAAVIYAKPHSTFMPHYCAESGVTQWLIMPGEELDFMNNIERSNSEVASLLPAEAARYFQGLGLSADIVAGWQNLARVTASGRGVQ